MPGWITGMLIATGILGVGVYLVLRARKWKQRAIRTDGKIIEFRRFGSGSNSEVKPVVEYEIKDGRMLEHIVNTSTMFDSFGVGKIVALYYDPDDPERARVARHLYLLPFIFFLVALIAAGIALSKHPDVIARYSFLQ